MARPPVAEVVAVHKSGGMLRLVLRMDPLPAPPAVPSSLHSLDGQTLRVLDLHRVVERNGDLISFESDEVDDAPVAAGERYGFREWWGPWGFALVQDGSRQWQTQEFQPHESVRYKAGQAVTLDLTPGADSAREDLGEGALVPGGWDHEHCALCFARISRHRGDQPEGYTDGRDWLCTACYRTYIASGLGRRLGDPAV